MTEAGIEMGSSIRRANGWDDKSDGVIFSYVDGFVWASWPGAGPKLRLGRYGTVTAEMNDFLAQCELGEKLAHATPKSALKPS